jgi:hypothetical protein
MAAAESPEELAAAYSSEESLVMVDINSQEQLREEEKVGLVVGAPGGEEERRHPVGREEGAWAAEEGRGHTDGLERCLDL